jgi:protein-disulfide isomerase
VDVAAARVDEFGLGIGDPQAPVKVEVFEDFQCPHCQAFEQAATDDLRAAAGDGSAFVVYRPMAFLNEWSARSMNAFGVVLETAGGEVALRFHDLLFANQPAGVAPSDDEIVAMAVEAGAVEDEVRGGIEGADFADWVADATDAASERGVTGTPTVFVDGEVVTGATIEQVLENTLAGIEAG